MAGLASGGVAVGALRDHSGAKLAAVRILMAGRAGTILKFVLDWFSCPGQRRHVALSARNRHVGPGERETGLLVASQCKHRRLESSNVVAILAAILVRRRGKLALVNILMTALARCLGDLVDGVLALGDVALVASN